MTISGRLAPRGTRSRGGRLALSDSKSGSEDRLPCAAMRQNLSSGTPWEQLAGYSRAVRLGSSIWVSGTTASDAAGQVQGDDAAAQTRYVLRKIESVLRDA